MATRKTIEKNDIEIARQKLLEAIYSELPDDRFVKRDAVKQLLGTLMAARERGLAFAKIAEILQQAGLALPAETLRTYFFQLKSRAELAEESARHVRKVAQTREAIQKQVLGRHAAHAHELVVNRARRPQATPHLVNAFGSDDAEPQPETVPSKPAESQAQITPGVLHGKRARPASPASPPPPPMAPEAARSDSDEVEAAGGGAKSTISGMPPTGKAESASPTIDAGRVPMTLTAIEAASRETEERTDLLGDVELRDAELVFYVSGRPFQGFLSQRQIHLLRTVGKLIAPTRGRSTKDFVTMPVGL
jgi:hypothetical protein